MEGLSVTGRTSCLPEGAAQISPEREGHRWALRGIHQLALLTSMRSFWFSSSRHLSFCCRVSYWKYCCKDSEDSCLRSLGTAGMA